MKLLLCLPLIGTFFAKWGGVLGRLRSLVLLKALFTLAQNVEGVNSNTSLFCAVLLLDYTQYIL